MKNKTKILLGVVIGIVIFILLIGGYFVGKYNDLVTMEENVNSKYAIIDVQLERRADLIPNLVSTVKGYLIYEQAVIDSITDARANLKSASTVEENASANRQLTTALNNLLVIVENYPDLKANQQFVQLQDELAGTENRISVARIDYNDAVSGYNKLIKSFPNNVIGTLFGFEVKEYFEADNDSDGVPNVSFE